MQRDVNYQDFICKVKKTNRNGKANMKKKEIASNVANICQTKAT